MLKKTLTSAISLLVLAGVNLPNSVQAQPRVPSITFGPGATSGGGCTPGQQIVSPDGRTLSILLDDFVAQNGRREKCNLRIPVEVPPGYLIQTVDVTYQGFKNVKRGGYGFFRSTYNVGSQVVRGAYRRFRGGEPDLFIENAPFKVAAFSQCGFSSNVGINMSTYASRGSEVSLDTVDIQALNPDYYAMVLTFNLAPCR